MQLALPWPEPDVRTSPTPLRSSERRVWVSRDLKLSRVSWIGFDMDYTLAIYHQEEMDRLSIRATADKMVARGYPPWIRDLHYPLDFPIRGLLIDKHLGNILKMNRFKIVRKGYHGLTELSRNDLRALYYERKLRHTSTRYHRIDTLYALSEACMYATIIDAYDKRRIKLQFGKLFNDIRECIDEAHRDGTVLRPVMDDPSRFLERDEALAETLHRFRSSGKKLFLLTNSRRAYTERLMTYLLENTLADYPSWQHYFDVIITGAKKPSFFQDRAPLMAFDDEGNTARATAPLERGRIYEGGNVAELQKMIEAPGNQILYVGDHIYGDMVRSKKDSVWRTAIIIPELDAELSAYQENRDDVARWTAVEARRLDLEDRLRHVQRRLRDLNRKADAESNGGNDALRALAEHQKQVLGAIRRQLRQLQRETRALRRAVDRRFHRFWGSLLKEQGELSLFGAQVDEYACVYTSRVSNLGAYSPNQYFRSPHNLMHHEM